MIAFWPWPSFPISAPRCCSVVSLGILLLAMVRVRFGRKLELASLSAEPQFAQL